MKEEIWKDIEGYEGLYQVSNLGRVRSFDRYVNAKGGGRSFRKGRILKAGKTKQGYSFVALTNEKSKQFTVHRLVAQAFLKKQNFRKVVNHIDGNKENNSVTNLEYVTSSENTKHAYKTGLKIASKKLKSDDVKTIRETYKPYDKQNNAKALAEKYSVSISTIMDVVNNRTHFDSDYQRSENNGKLTKNEIEEIKKTYTPYRDKNVEFFSKKYGVAKSTIEKILGKSKKTKITEVEEKEIVESFIPYDRNFGIAALSKKYGVDRKLITKILKK